VRCARSPPFPALSLFLSRSLFPLPVYSVSNARCPSSPNPSLSLLAEFGESLGRFLDYPNSAIFGFHTIVRVLLIMLRFARGLFSKCSSLFSCPAFSFTFIAPCYAYCFLFATESIAMHSFLAFSFMLYYYLCSRYQNLSLWD